VRLHFRAAVANTFTRRVDVGAFGLTPPTSVDGAGDACLPLTLSSRVAPGQPGELARLATNGLARRRGHHLTRAGDRQVPLGDPFSHHVTTYLRLVPLALGHGAVPVDGSLTRQHHDIRITEMCFAPVDHGLGHPLNGVRPLLGSRAGQAVRRVAVPRDGSLDSEMPNSQWQWLGPLPHVDRQRSGTPPWTLLADRLMAADVDAFHAVQAYARAAPLKSLQDLRRRVLR
jgi:hypothetical protein